MRDDFSRKTKRELAERVAYHCGFPDCTARTIGPDLNDPAKSLLLGEAPHITAASPGGPRYDDGLSQAERRGHANGIWMCRHHARLVDADKSYTDETLRLWKQQAEHRAGADLARGYAAGTVMATTLVGLGLDLVLEAEWAGWSGTTEPVWEFRVVGYVRGGLEDLIRFLGDLPGLPTHQRVVVVESQGEGRVLRSGASLKREGTGQPPLLVLPVEQPSARSDPSTIGRSPVMTDDGEFAHDGAGRMVMVSGIEDSPYAATAGMTDLKFDAWFERFNNTGPVHPYAEGDDEWWRTPPTPVRPPDDEDDA